MSFLIKELVRRKLKQLTSEEIYSYALDYGFSISKEQANKIADYLRQFNGDPFKQRDREIMFQELANITDSKTANAARRLLNEVVKSYGLEHLLE